MSQQAEFLKNVRETLTKAQSNASSRLGELVEKGKASQKDLTEKLSKLELAPKVEEIQKRVKSARENAVTFVDTTGRAQAATVAAELRKVADRLEKLAQKSVETPVVH